MHNANIIQSLEMVGSRSQNTVASMTHAGARFCIQIAFAGGPPTSAVKYVQFMSEKQIVIGTNRQSHVGLRINGTKISKAKTALQNANAAPRISVGQTSNNGDLAKSALVLQSIAARTQ